MYPETGKLARKNYAKHLEFFELSKEHNEVAFIAANRAGKSTASAFATACHATGLYPAWWPGRVFDGAINTYCAGTTAKTTRDIMQKELCGEPGSEADLGTGMLPKDTILRTSVKHGLANAFESVHVRHVSGDTSVIQFLSYDQGRPAFEGTTRHLIALDEECPEDIYAECLLRTMTVNGLVLLTFTPNQGLTPLVLSFLPHMQPKAE